MAGAITDLKLTSHATGEDIAKEQAHGEPTVINFDDEAKTYEEEE